MNIIQSKWLTIFILSVLVVSCKGTTENDKANIDPEVLDLTSSLNTNFEGKIYSIPSPVQTALLLKKTDVPFQESLLNPVSNIDNYNTEFRQAINLGIYGADLSYASLYNQKSISLKYLSAIEEITSKLGLEAAFDKEFMKRYERNSTNQDSMLIIVSESFRKADNFLKTTNRKSTSALILTGGWIESLYYACEINRKEYNTQIVERIGEQQLTLHTIIDILSEYNNKGSNKELITALKDLNFYFNKVHMDYTYVEPITEPTKKLTTLRHHIEIKVDTDILNQITLLINSIREKLIN
jgi:hypothetical protein